MIYLPNSITDQQLLAQSRELVREALVLLRDSDHLVSAMRLRDEPGPSKQMRESQPSGYHQAKGSRGVG
jgi:hypothetical protein